MVTAVSTCLCFLQIWSVHQHNSRGVHALIPDSMHQRLRDVRTVQAPAHQQLPLRRVWMQSRWAWMWRSCCSSMLCQCLCQAAMKRSSPLCSLIWSCGHLIQIKLSKLLIFFPQMSGKFFLMCRWRNDYSVKYSTFNLFSFIKTVMHMGILNC